MTLTDVMRGIYKQRIITKLPEELFTFLIGIIQEHNEVGFKDDFDMTNAQAMAAGGGNNRQSVKRRRDALAKFKIDGTAILVVEGGNRGKSTCCKYRIDYNLICRYNGIWSRENQVPSQKYNGSRDDGDTRAVTQGMREADVSRDYPKTRSEEKREEQNPLPPNTFTTTDGRQLTEQQLANGVVAPLDGKEEKKDSDTWKFIKFLKEKFKLPSEPAYTRVNEMVYKYGLSACLSAAESSNPDSKQWKGILAYIGKVASGISAESRGITGEKLDKMEKEYKDLVQELKDYKLNKPEDKELDMEWVTHQMEKTERIREAIISYGGNVIEW